MSFICPYSHRFIGLSSYDEVANISLHLYADLYANKERDLLAMGTRQVSLVMVVIRADAFLPPNGYHSCSNFVDAPLRSQQIEL